MAQVLLYRCPSFHKLGQNKRCVLGENLCTELELDSITGIILHTVCLAYGLLALDGVHSVMFSLSALFGDTRSFSLYRKTLWTKLRTRLQYSSVYHSQTDGQIEIVNRNLRYMMRCLAREKPK